MDIITKEIIYESSDLPAAIVCSVAIGAMIALMVHLYTKRNTDFTVKAMAWIICIAFPLMLVATMLGNTVFVTPTDRYEYTAKLDETVSMVEFYESYTNIECKDGIWYFEDRGD